jgi:hypothetical protein
MITIKLFGIKLTLGKSYNRKEYMKMYMRKHRKRLNKYNKFRYNNNINGTRDKKLKYAKRKRHPLV